MSDKEQVIQALRATLISVKGALTIKQCNRDYKELQGEWIPFKRLGYPTLDKLFLDVPGFKVTHSNGECYVDAIATQETQHIASMVAKQKTAKKSVKYPSRFPKSQGSWRKPTSYTPNYHNQYSNQYYRARGDSTHYNNNYKSVKYNYKSIEAPKPAPARQPPRQPAQNNSREDRRDYSHNSQNKNTTPAAPPAQQDAGAHTDEHKAASRVSSTDCPPEARPSGKVSASQRLSNLRDRLSTVDCIPLHMPNASNDTCLRGAVAHVAPALQEPPPDTCSSVLKLEWTCRKLGLQPPLYKVHNLHSKGQGPGSYCSVKVGTTYSASSYPASSPSEELARELAAAKLLAAVESAEGGGVPTSAPHVALDHLADLVAECDAGLWATTVPHMYRQKYGENLPSNWQELVESCPRIIKDRLVNGLFVLLPNKEEWSAGPPAAPGEELDGELPPLQFPQEQYWNVHVTVATSPVEIWLRIRDDNYDGALKVLLDKMNEYYEELGTSVDRAMVVKDRWYAVKLEEDGWLRAKVLDVHEDSVTAFLGDHGEEDEVPLHCVRVLEPQFRTLPAQGILCRLEGAEELAAHPRGAQLVAQRLQNEVLVAAPGARADPLEQSVPLELYNTSTSKDVNLNKEIVEDFCIAGAFVITKEPCEVQVSCVLDEGGVWVTRAGGADTVRAALRMLTAGQYRRPLPPAPPAPSPADTALYIVRTLAGDWVRCSIISGLDGEGTVRTQLVDSGLILRAPLSSLVPLQTFSPALNRFPPQAVLVQLGEAARVAPSMAPRLRELLLGASVLCRALPPPAGAPTSAQHVELFVRTGPQNILASVNHAILLEYNYLRLDKKKEEEEVNAMNPVEALAKRKERIYRSASSGVAGDAAASPGAGGGALPPPPLPARGAWFDVNVAMAANPWNFVVQPHGSRSALAAMMVSLQSECPKLAEADAPCNPVSGELYTVYYDKYASWYRVTVAGCVSADMVSVYFCDYGDLALFATRQLRPVPAAAPLARSLPPQALKARLYDVWPLHQDWTVEDCVRFQELCVEQQFVAVCKDIGRDPLNPSEPLVTLDLVDTSTDEDLYLNQQLVAEGRARLGSASASSTSSAAAN